MVLFEPIAAMNSKEVFALTDVLRIYGVEETLAERELIDSVQ